MPDEATWQEIERAYCHTKERIPDIADRYGIDPSAIHKRAQKYGWPRRRAPKGAVESTPLKTATLLGARDAVATQLYRRMSQRLAQMEQGAAAAGERPVADDPDERMLTQLIRQFEKLTGLDGISQRQRAASGREQQSARQPAGGRSAASARSPVPEQQHAPALDAERMRREIVERLERLHAERLARRDSE